MMMSVADQFLAVVPLRSFQWPLGLSYSTEEQQRLIEATLLCPLCKQYPPPLPYRLRFLKHLLTEAEQRGHEVADKVYELYGALVGLSADETCFKSYNLGECGYITLNESTHLISGGTTGLATWQAALYFVEWVAENRDIFRKRRVLELGSGLGLAGIAMCRLCQPTAYHFTDCHDSVMERLRENVRTNLLDSCKKQIIEVSVLDWTSSVDHFMSSHDKLDCIVATDVVYDLKTTNAVVQVLEVFLRTYENCVGYIASTVRNEETYKHFCTKLGDAGITRRVVQGPIAQIFYFDRSQRIEILEIKLTRM